MIAEEHIRMFVLQILTYILSFKKFFDWLIGFIRVNFFTGFGFDFYHVLVWYNLLFHLHLCMPSPRNLRNTTYIFPAWVHSYFFSATLKYQDHNLLRSENSCINLQLIFWIILSSFLIIFLCWNPVQQEICYLAFTSGSGFFLQDVTGNLRCYLYSLDKDQPLQTEF